MTVWTHMKIECPEWRIKERLLKIIESKCKKVEGFLGVGEDCVIIEAVDNKVTIDGIRSDNQTCGGPNCLFWHAEYECPTIEEIAEVKPSPGNAGA
ncbi:hypothetical protein [Vulcanisaeta souniana]|uniref:Uncharacterized protein n=2 Tax=Vulcanisaeta souniana JCM 11219 TaxID=1293586 RepID=A0A830EMS2_9CREN|nr:hypothetical protein [Vulcanisaeta souniana]GGI86094.1 hypothetical protein GCM10007112_23870 [Vulcanisaeta souniana JCM 11219]